MNPFFLTDVYKIGHHRQYKTGTSLVYSNFTARSFKHAPKGCDKLVVFGTQMVFKQIHKWFDEGFFKRDKAEVIAEIKEAYSGVLGSEYDTSHIEALHDLGFLPIKVKGLQEGALVGPKVPVLTIRSTAKKFFWITNFLETIISNLLWKPMTSASIAHAYRKLFTAWALKTDKENLFFVNFQGHDFSMRGMDSVDAVCSSGLGHALSFLGSDSLPVVSAAKEYYNHQGPVIFSVPATEHSVACSLTTFGPNGETDELQGIRDLMAKYPTGILSMVSDTFDLWRMHTEYLPILKDEIMARDGKLVIRPDSGDPVDIICGKITRVYATEVEAREDFRNDLIGKLCNVREVELSRLVKIGDKYFELIATPEVEVGIQPPVIAGADVVFRNYVPTPADLGVIELLWNIFSGTTNAQGFKVLDSHIGAIYGDSITLDRAQSIFERLAAKGFASTNIVLGIGSFTYQYNTRDTFGFAMKATYVEDENGVGRNIFKDPITDDGMKKSAVGLLKVVRTGTEYELLDKVTWDEEADEETGCLKTLYFNGELTEVTFDQTRATLAAYTLGL